MIKVWTYPLQHHPSCREVIVQDEHFQAVDSPAQADWLYCPVDLGALLQARDFAHGDPRGGQAVRDFVAGLEHYAGNEPRHFFHDYSAYADDWGLKSVLFRAVKSRHDPNPLTVSIPHTVEDFRPTPVEFSTLPYDVCFVGRRTSCPGRKEAVQAVARDSAVRSYLVLRESFWGYLERDDPVVAAKQRRQFVEAMQMSKMVLSPRGVEYDAYRTWEAMSAGRVPIWMGDDYELPFREYVDYGEFMFVFPESDAPLMNERIRQILATHTSAQLQAHGERGRQVWLEWFSKEARSRTFALYLRRFM